MLSITIKDDDKIIFGAKGNAIMDVLLAFAMHSHDEDFDRAARRWNILGLNSLIFNR